MHMNTHNLFISHSWSYSDSYERLLALLKKRTYFRFRNYSVPRSDPVHNARNDSALRNAIRNQMRRCGVVLVVAGVYATYSEWIDIEIGLAQSGFTNPKPNMAVFPLDAGQVNSLTPVG